MDRSDGKGDGERALPPTEAAGASHAGAGAILTIDLSAVRSNYRLLRDRLGGGRCAGVVKADGYGLGASRISAALADEGCDTFFVAHLAEGLSLKPGLSPSASVYILNGLPPGSEPGCAQAGLIPVLNSETQLSAWRRQARAEGRILPAAIQVDSGMSRLGMPPVEVARVANDPQALAGIDLRLAMSHLARADEPWEGANEAQRNAFETLARMLPKAPWSLANSSGIFLGPAYRYDLARPGAALYGLNPLPGTTNPMAPVVRLRAKVIQTRAIDAGTGIGYGHVALAPRAMEVATIGLGYADGWPRRAVTAAHFEGVTLPFIGRVSMDSIILDVSSLPPGALAPGDLVDLVGGRQTIDHLAVEAGTIGYEILTGLGRRFHRIYEDARALAQPP